MKKTLSGVVSGVVLAFASQVASAQAGVATSTPPSVSPDRTLYATYDRWKTEKGEGLGMSVCGSTKETSGCYGWNVMGPFNRICGLIEGEPKTEGNITTRDIYVLDGQTKNDWARIHVYKRMDILTDDHDTVLVSKAYSKPLPVMGGPKVKCSMAANNKFLFIGTSLSNNAVKFKKASGDVETLPGFTPDIPVTGITVNRAGYVSVQQGSSNSNGGFYLYGPNGELEASGGGSATFGNTKSSLVPKLF